MPTIVNLPFKTVGESVVYGDFDSFLIDWSDCETTSDELDQLALNSEHDEGVIRFEDNQPVGVFRS